ncbi:ribosome-recycling factor [Planctomycetota bacterium]|nr:ribosome-recycling factor [Planctomycetota bacterium]
MFESEIADTKAKFEKALTALGNDFKQIRAGQAQPSMLDRIQVEAYGSMMPLAQCASVSVPEPATLVIKPWDKGMLKAIEKALVEANLGMMPQNDGVVVRLNLPPLSTERRKELAGQTKEIAEKHKVAMRNLRRDAIKDIEIKAKAQKAPEDVAKKTSEKITDLLKQYEAKAEAAQKEKADSILKF